MAVLNLRVDVPGATADTPLDEVVEPIVNRFNDWLRAVGREGQQVGLDIREATWVP